MKMTAEQIEVTSEALADLASGIGGGNRPRVSQTALNKLMARHQARLDARKQSWDREEENFRSMVASALGGESWEKFSGLLGDRRSLDEMTSNPRIRAKYDSAQTVADNREHWTQADSLSAMAAHSEAVRSILRMRARYEVANNCYASGVGLTIANDFCGTGPRLNLTTKDEDINNAVEELFAAWARAVNLARLLRTMRYARRQDGEAFALFISNPGIEDVVKLGIKLIEADQVQGFNWGLDSKRVDGIWFDDYDNPIKYDILRNHPGSINSKGSLEYDVWPRKLVLHWFRPTRPSQHRGVPEITPALPLYATLRRYTQATLDAAESAADMAILLYTQAGAEFTDAEGQPASAESAEPFTEMPFHRRMFISLPQGYEAKQFEAKQPTQMYSNFKREIAGEIGRCENISRNVVLLDSSESNFASGQLDHRTTYRGHEIDRDDAGKEILDRIFRAWLDEASLITGYLPQEMRQSGPLPPHTWYWDSNELGDPLKMANAKTANLANGLTSLPVEYAAKGQDWNKALAIAARGYGITVPELQKLICQNIFAKSPIPAAKPEVNQDSQDQQAEQGTQNDQNADKPVPEKTGAATGDEE